MKFSNHIIHYIIAISHFLCTISQEIHQWTIPHIYYKDTNRLHIKINFLHRNYVLDLKPNHFLASNYHETALSNDYNQTKGKSPEDWCHYRGTVSNFESSWAAISYCNNKLNGIFQVDNTIYHIQQLNDEKKVKIFTKPNTNYRCGYENGPQILSQNIRTRRDIEDVRSNVFNVTRYIELVIVNDYKVFTKYGKSTEAIFERSKQIANIVNSLYSSFNILIALVGVVVWNEKNEIDITSDSSQTLNNFLKYRRDVLMKKYPNDNAQLITGASFESGIVGKALKQTLCTYEYSGGVNSDYSESISLVATTIAHELGHNIGMEHDTNGCDCRGKNCIMGPSSSFPSPRHWSSCSIKQVAESFKHGIDHCLFNKPSILFRPNCGNGFVDDGEECDCGLAETCNNPCCNATTCTFVKGAECANGDCCNRKTCKIISSNSKKVCRPAKSICDIAETCDGHTENCPKDLIVKDGTECQAGYAYCFAGQCNPREQQCKLLWGNSGEVADYRCYQHNLNASTSGNCGYDKERKKYISCNTSKDIICGRLHCTHQTEKLEYGPEGAALISKSMEFRKGKLIYCYSTVIDLGLNEFDPGLVPNGAKCGSNSMCIDQKCVSITKYVMKNPCPYNCNNNGYCDNEGNCHCFDGFDSYDCSGGHGRYFFTVLIYIIFLLVLPILTLTAFIFYNNQQRIKKWFGKKKLSSQDYNIKKRKKLPLNLEISVPMETIQHNQNQITTFPITKTDSDHNSLAILKPIRPAPPVPKFQTATLENQQQSTMPATFIPHSNVSNLNQGTLRKSNVRRPRKPPPQPPLPDVCDSSNESDLGVKKLIHQFESA